MTTRVPEPDSPYESGWDAGAAADSERDYRADRDNWRRPGASAVPGWGAGQDFYTGPIYDDTGWHIDLSGVDWAARPRTEDRPGRAGRRAGPGSVGTPFRPDGNGSPRERPKQQEPDTPPDARGRHARHSRAGADGPPGGPGVLGPGVRGGRRAGPPSAPPPRSAPGRPVPARRPPGPPQPGQPPSGQPPSGQPPSGQLQPPGYPPGQAFRAPPGQRRPPEELSQRGRPAAGAQGRLAPPDLPQPGSAVTADAGTATGRPTSIVRSSGVMAVGTLGSRLTGFLRTIAQSYALGAAGLAAAYNLSNTLPNVVYNLALGGILTSVIVPLIVNAARRDSDRGEGYDQRMFTLVTLALAGVTLVAMALAVPIVHLYAGSKISGAAATLHLAVIFALFFIPQIFFYGVSSLVGAILNARGSFAAPMWTPIVNNVVVIAVLGMYVGIAGLHRTPASVTGFQVGLLGLGTTLGIIAQTIALLPALRRVGFRWRPRTDFRRAEVNEIGRMAGWMFGYVAATQVAFLVTTKVASSASTAGITEYNYAWLLFQLPYAVVGISVITALLPRMSAHASERRYALVQQDFSAGIRLAAAIVVPCSLVLAVLGAALAELFLAHGAMTPAQARYTGVVFAVFCLGLLPYMIFQLQLRVFYSLHDSKTPAVIGAVTMVVNIVTNLIALAALPASQVVAGLGVGFGLSNVAGMLVAWRILTRRLRGLDGYLIGRSLVRMHAAALPAALFAVVVEMLTGNAIIDVVIGGGLAAGLYFLFARALRIDEVSSLGRTVLARLGR